MSETINCCICNKEILNKESHNAAPIVDNGRCCKDCNNKVIAARLSKVLSNTMYKIHKKRAKE